MVKCGWCGSEEGEEIRNGEVFKCSKCGALTAIKPGIRFKNKTEFDAAMGGRTPECEELKQIIEEIRGH